MPYSIKIEIIASYLCSTLYAVISISSWTFLHLKLVGIELGPALHMVYHVYLNLNMFFPSRDREEAVHFAKEKNAGEYAVGFSVLRDRSGHSLIIHVLSLQQHQAFWRGLGLWLGLLPELRIWSDPPSCWQVHDKDLHTSKVELQPAIAKEISKHLFLDEEKAWNVEGGGRFLFLTREVWIVLLFPLGAIKREQ